MKTLITRISRLLLSLTFIFSGFIKANDPVGMSYKITDYFVAFSIPAPQWLTISTSIVMAIIEFTLGICLFSDKKIIQKLTVALMSIFTLFTVYIYFANPVSDCGCFGEVITLTNGQTLLKNIILLGAAIALLKWNKKLSIHIPNKKTFTVSAICSILILAYSLFCLMTLPCIDTTPYKKGTSLTEKIPIPEKPEIQAAKFQVHGFIIEDETEEDITRDILSLEKETYVVIAPTLSEVCLSKLGSLNELYDSATKEGKLMFVLTASSQKETEIWRDETAAEFPIFFSEERVLETVIRSNPGLVILEKGIIKDKFGNMSFEPNIKKIINKNLN